MHTLRRRTHCLFSGKKDDVSLSFQQAPPLPFKPMAELALGGKVAREKKKENGKITFTKLASSYFLLQK